MTAAVLPPLDASGCFGHRWLDITPGGSAHTVVGCGDCGAVVERTWETVRFERAGAGL